MILLQEMFSDSISYLQFKAAMLSLETAEPVTDDAIIPACVLAGAFLINTALIYTWNGQDKAKLVNTTTAIFVIGGLLSVLTYFI